MTRVNDNCCGIITNQGSGRAGAAGAVDWIEIVTGIGQGLNRE